MSVEVSPPLVLGAPPVAEHPAAARRRDAPPPPRAASRLDLALNRIVASQSVWLTPVLLLQAVLAFRLTNGLSDDEALTINSGHQMIAHLLHGTATPDFGRYFGGVPAVYAVPAAILDHVGGTTLVRGVNTGCVLLATVLVYRVARRMFGQGAALLAAAAFALTPASLFVSRYAGADAAALLLVAAGLWAVTRPGRGVRHSLLAGAFLATAVAFRYDAILYVAGVLAIAASLDLQGGRPPRRTVLLPLAATAAGLAVWAGLAHHDLAGFASTALGGRIASEIPGATLVRHGWDAVGVIAVASVASVLVVRRRRLVGGLCVAGLGPVVVQVAAAQPAALQRNIGLTMVFLGPVLGVLGMWLLGRGPRLALRAPVALVGAVALLSSGMGTSVAMMHSWPTLTSIESALRYYAHDGSQRYLVDGSSLPAYYLSDVTSYNQWVSTMDTRYAGAGGAQRLHEDVESGVYRLVLYRDDGATPALDRSMTSTLHGRYTLVARVPVTRGDTNAYWSLWLSELPR